MSISVAFALAAFCAWCLIYLVLRFVSANLGYRDTGRDKVGLAGLIGLAAGTLYLTGFLLKWGREDWMTYEWEREWRSFGEYSDIGDLTIRWFEEFFAYAYDLFWVVHNMLPGWNPDLWSVVPYLGMALAALIGISAIVRRSKGKTISGPLQDLAIGFFAPVGIVSLLGFGLGAFAVVFAIVGLLIVGLMFGLVRLPARRI